MRIDLDENESSIIKEPRNQISEDDGIWYSAGLTVVTSLSLAKTAMDTIIIQGEGSSGGHHKTFVDLVKSSEGWTYYPVPENPKTSSYQGKIFYEVNDTFLYSCNTPIYQNVRSYLHSTPPIATFSRISRGSIGSRRSVKTAQKIFWGL